MTDLFSPIELKARQILRDAQADDAKWSPGRAIVLNTFRAMWANSLPATKVAEIGNAMESCNASVEAFKPILTALVREKVLRSRRSGGETLYEINY